MFRNPLIDAIVVLIVVLLFFGPKRLPALAKSIGESVREFRGGIGSDEEEKPALNRAAEHEPAATDPTTASPPAPPR